VTDGTVHGLTTAASLMVTVAMGCRRVGMYVMSDVAAV